jgi:hypothetical protein
MPQLRLSPVSGELAERGITLCVARLNRRLRRNLGRCILLGLEVLIVADIVRTIVVDATFEGVTVLALIVLIRIVLSIALEVEIDGTWPWNRQRANVSRQDL